MDAGKHPTVHKIASPPPHNKELLAPKWLSEITLLLGKATEHWRASGKSSPFYSLNYPPSIPELLISIRHR